MKEGNTQITLHNESIEFLTGKLTMLAQILRATRQHDHASQIEDIRNTIQAQFYPTE